MILNSPYISGSLTVTGNIITSGSIIISGSIASASYAVSASEASKLQGLGSSSFAPAATFNTVSQSYAASSASLSTRVTNEEATSSVLTSASSSFAIVSSSYATASGSLSTRVTNLEVTTSVVSSSFATTSGSLSSRVTLIEGQYATTGSNTFTGPQYISQASNAISFTSTASLYTDGGLRVAKDSFVSGTAYFNNITVYGTSSIEYITSSQVNIGSNVITVNTDTPAIRFGGISVFDSGSTQLTGSLFWDSEKNHWIYSNPSGSSYNSAMLMNGPRNTGSLGDEQGTTNNALMKGQGGDHITSSQITETGTATTFYSNALYVTASGNVALGLTSSAWVGATGLQVQYATVEGRSALPSFAEYAANSYSDSGVRYYIASDYASRYTQYQGAHIWNTAPSGTAGNAITFTQAMTLDASGNLGVGVTSINTKIEANGKIRSIRSGVASQYLDLDGGTSGAIYLTAAGSAKPLVIQNNNTTSSDIYFDQAVASQYIFRQAGTDRLTIASTGAATFSSSVSGTSIRSSAVGSFGFNTVNNGEFQIYATALDGMIMAGRGSTNDMVITNKNGNDVFRIPTGTTTANFVGNVGIGTTSPDYPLTVQANSSAAQAVKLLGRSADNISILSFHNNANSTQYGYIAGIPTEFRINSGTNIPITFTNLDTERMRITSGGNVGIGTATDYSSKLTIIPSSNPTSSTGANNQISIGEVSNNTGYCLKLGYIYTGGGYQGSIQSIAGAAGSTLFLNASGGNVIIGSTTDSNQKLTVNGSYVRMHSLSTDNTNAGVFYEVKSGGTTVGQSSQLVDNAGNYIITTGTSSETERVRITSGGIIQLGSSERRNALQQSTFGYGGSYRTLLIGSTGTDYTTNAVTLAFNVDLSGNPSGAYGGDGTEYFWRNVGSFKTPNSSNNGYNTLLSWNSSGVVTVTTSDYRAKEDLKSFEALPMIQAMKLYDFRWIELQNRMHGVLAHELQDIVPYAVMGEKDGESMQGVDYSKLVPIMLKAIQEQQAQIEALKARIETLEK